MALILQDRVNETASITGTGPVTLLGAALSYQSFSSVMAAGDTCYYTIADQTGNNWEVGLGTYSGVNTLDRTQVFTSSNANTIVTFAGGTQNVFITYAADRAIAQGRALVNNMVYGL